MLESCPPYRSCNLHRSARQSPPTVDVGILSPLPLPCNLHRIRSPRALGVPNPFESPGPQRPRQVRRGSGTPLDNAECLCNKKSHTKPPHEVQRFGVHNPSPVAQGIGLHVLDPFFSPVGISPTNTFDVTLSTFCYCPTPTPAPRT